MRVEQLRDLRRAHPSGIDLSILRRCRCHGLPEDFPAFDGNGDAIETAGGDGTEYSGDSLGRWGAPGAHSERKNWFSLYS